MTANFTPGPWTAHLEPDEEHGNIYGGGHTIATVDCRYGRIGEPEANAAYIVRAVNCHEEMLDVLRAVETTLSRNTASEGEYPSILDIVRLAIAKAEGG